MTSFLNKHAILIAFATACIILTSCSQNNPNTNAVSSQVPLDTTIQNEVHKLNEKGDVATHQGDYPAALSYFQQAMDAAAANGDSFAYYDAKLDFACVHDRLNELPKAISIAKPVLEAYMRSGDSSRIGRAYATLSAFYTRAGMDAEGLATARKGFDILKYHGSLIERCAAYNQMAFTYSDRNDWASALPLLDSALLFMRSSGEMNQIAGMYLNIGNGHRKMQHWREAEQFFNLTIEEAKSRGQAHIHSKAIERLSQIAEATHQPEKALALYKTSIDMRDSLFTAEKEKAIESLQVAFETKEKEQEIALLKASNTAKYAERNLALALLLFTILTAATLILLWRKKLARSKTELAQSQLQLHEFAQFLMAKNAQLADREMPEHTSEDFHNHRILTETDWNVFKKSFERGHPGYLARLRAAFPELSPAEERLALLYKLKFTRSEIAATLGISPESVKKGRTRLRKRLNIEQEEDLEAFLEHF